MSTGTTPVTHRPRTRRARLSREVIVTAALAYIDEHGPHGLTMRDLGRRLGVEAMSLYRYVTGREDLLEAVVDRLMHDLQDRISADLASTWQGYLQALAHEVRAMALRHPLAFPLVATRHPAAPWLRPPLRSLTLVEHVLSTVRGHGFTDLQAVQIYRAFSSFLLGHLLLETSLRGAEIGAVDLPIAEEPTTTPGGDQELELDNFPTVVRLRSMLTDDRSEEEFEAALETLLDRLELTLDQ